MKKTIITTVLAMLFAGSALAGDLPSTKVLVEETTITTNPWAITPFVGGNVGYAFAASPYGTLGVEAGAQTKYFGFKGAYEFYDAFNSNTANVVRAVPFVQYPLAYNITPFAGLGLGYAWHNNGASNSIYTVEGGLKYHLLAKTDVLAWYEYDHALNYASKPDNAIKIGVRQSF